MEAVGCSLCRKYVGTSALEASRLAERHELCRAAAAPAPAAVATAGDVDRQLPAMAQSEHGAIVSRCALSTSLAAYTLCGYTHYTP